MQTAISIPEPLFTQAEQLAMWLGLTRKEFYLRAVDKGSITEQLNEVYATEESTVDSVLWQLQMMSLPQGEW